MSVRQIVPDVVAQFRQELTDLVKSVDRDELDPEEFIHFVDGLKAVLASAGRRAFVGFVGFQDEAGDLFDHDGKQCRFKQVSTKEWLTPFGVVQVDRRYSQPDAGGDGVSPIDLRCGMSSRFMTPDVEEATAFYVSNLGFEIEKSFAPAIAILVRGDLTLLVSGPKGIGVQADAGWHDTQFGRRLEQVPPGFRRFSICRLKAQGRWCKIAKRYYERGRKQADYLRSPVW